MIVTTNIPLSVMQKAADLDERRIYDRVLEVCVPIQFNGENFRKGNAAENVKRAAKILNQDKLMNYYSAKGAIKWKIPSARCRST